MSDIDGIGISVTRTVSLASPELLGRYIARLEFKDDVAELLSGIALELESSGITADHWASSVVDSGTCLTGSAKAALHRLLRELSTATGRVDWGDS